MAFRIHEGRQVAGTLAWASAAAPGSIRGREAPIELAGTYRLQWRDYTELPDGNAIRALLIHASSPGDHASMPTLGDRRVSGAELDDA